MNCVCRSEIIFLFTSHDFCQISSWHRVVELIGSRPVQNSSTCQSGTQYRVLSIWGCGSGLVSQVPCLGDAIVVVGILKNMSN